MVKLLVTLPWKGYIWALCDKIETAKIENCSKTTLNPWCGDRPLKLCYPILYTLARFSDAWVVDNLSVVDGVAYW
jgi:hypothetical protein